MLPCSLTLGSDPDACTVHAPITETDSNLVTDRLLDAMTLRIIG